MIKIKSIIGFLKSIPGDKELSDSIVLSTGLVYMSIFAGIAGYTISIVSYEMSFKNVLQIVLFFIAWGIMFHWINEDIDKTRGV